MAGLVSRCRDLRRAPILASACGAPGNADARPLTELGITWPEQTRPHVRRFYELPWVLSEIAEYVARFTTAHEADIDEDAKWSELLPTPS
jgi:hypothetical protein